MATITRRHIRPKNKAGNSIVYNRMYERIIYVQEDWVRVEKMTQ